MGAQVTRQGVRFRVWSPDAEQVAVALYENGSLAATHDLQPDPEEAGYWVAEVRGIGAGARYAFSIDGGEPRPDPASRWQPDGVHAPSAVVDAASHQWQDQSWHGMPLDDLIIYEIHVGTATPEGTFEALIEKLPYFRELGVTALELLPIHGFPGCRNWGYDGVNLYAPVDCYGGPHGLKRLVDAAHAHGLAIILDVVYNHFGPDGNYLRVFSPRYFTDRHCTPWGDALNLDGEGSQAVRSYLINNALYWAHEYHIDGLRLDATHELIDDSPQHFLQQLTAAVCATLPIERHFVISAEDERNDPKLARSLTKAGYGLDAIWADDFHHQVRIALTGEQHGYYANYTGTIPDLVKTISDGWFYQGQQTINRERVRGASPRELQLPQFVYCIQNHDQIGNRPIGDRLNHTVDPAAYRAASALLLLLPHTPLLFQGQEWAASSPFQFFTDHNEELGVLVTEGRRKEFAYFLTETGIVVPDPQMVDSFERSKLRWDELDRPEHAPVLALYHELLRLRRSHPALLRREREALTVTPIADRALVLRREGLEPQQTLLAIVNLGDALHYALDGETTAWQMLLDTNDSRFGGLAPAEIASAEAGRQMVQMNAPGVLLLQAT
ncbi:MAG: malto-oligosyltrehalose trehalohydrolase [Chloroflexi bacterium]|nr:malto-oligosyltrehalose trehalohydrolase [Chloroflexota bacterium]